MGEIFGLKMVFEYYQRTVSGSIKASTEVDIQINGFVDEGDHT